MLLTVAQTLAGLVGAFGVFLGVNAFRTPRAALGFGIPGTPVDDATFQAWLHVKAVRDIASGVLILILVAGATPGLLGWCMLAAAGIPVGDALIVLRSKGTRAAAFGIHGATAAAMAAVSALLFLA
jgi:hypothetical protein